MEIGLGAVLHSLRVPLSGHFLALNQAFLLSRAMREVRAKINAREACRAPFTISSISALLKSLSPAGKKLTPMLAIAAQGFWFSLGARILGPNLAGAFLGGALLSVWPFAQPLLIYYLLFGKALATAGEYFLERLQAIAPITSGQLTLALAGWLILQTTAGMAAAAAGFLLSREKFDQLERKLVAASSARMGKVEREAQTAWRGALRDLFNPLFVVFLTLTLFFFIASEASYAQTAWALLRPVAAGFLLFYLVRAVAWDRVISRMESQGFASFAGSFRVAVASLKKL